MTQKGSSAGCQRATAGMKTSFISHKCALIGRRTKVGCHSFRATGITEYLRNGGKLEIAQQMAGHESARTTGLYDRRDDQIALDEVERIAF